MEEKGTVYFFTGLSGAGKTTLGSLFYQRLKKKKPNVILLDGDVVRDVFYNNKMGYSDEERLNGALHTFKICKFMAEQGIDVVFCSISMYSQVREWNRNNIQNYKEIYIKVKKETLLKRNQKGLYTSGKNVVGVDLPFDEPKTPDIIIQNDGDKTPEEIVDFFESKLSI